MVWVNCASFCRDACTMLQHLCNMQSIMVHGYNWQSWTASISLLLWHLGSVVSGTIPNGSFWQDGFEWYFQSDWAAIGLPQVPHSLWRSFYFFHKTGQIYLLLTLLLIAATFLCIAETGLNDFQLISLPPGYWFSFRRQRSSKQGPLTGFSSVSDHGRMKVQLSWCWETIPLHLHCSAQHTVSLELWKSRFIHRGNNICIALSCTATYITKL